MIVALPPDHPIEALTQAIHSQVRTLPDIAPHLMAHDTVRVSTDLYSDPARSNAEDVWGSADHEGITFYPGTHASRPLAVASRLGQVILGHHRLATLDHLWMDGRGRIIERTRGARYLTADQGEMFALVLHETLHRTVPADKWSTMTPAQRSVEEGVVDAVTHDLAPWAAARIFRAELEQPPRRSYFQCRALIRKASGRATSGERGWREPDARRWRRGFLTLTPQQRETTLERLGLVPGCSVNQ